jgi:MFS family permease
MSFKLFVCLQVVSVFGNICSWFLIDRVGRRNLTLWGTMLLTVILLLCGGLAAAGTTKSIKACIAFMIVYGWFYNITIGSTAYTLLTEVATSRLRVKTISIGIACQSAWYTMWSFTLPYLFNPNKANLGAKVHLPLALPIILPTGMLTQTPHRLHSSSAAYQSSAAFIFGSTSPKPLDAPMKSWTSCSRRGFRLGSSRATSPKLRAKVRRRRGGSRLHLSAV